MAFVRSMVRNGNRRLQVWRSLSTGRQFEVQETESYALSADLVSGQEAYLTFVGGKATVTGEPLDRLERAQRRQEALANRPHTSDRRQRRSNPVGLVLVAVLVVLILWVLL